VVLFKRVGIAALLVAPVMALALPAQAAGTASSATGAPVAAAALPKTTISGKPAVFKPTTLTATPHWNGVATCTAALESFTITNSTLSSETILRSNGTALGTLASHQTAGVCINTNQAGLTDTFTLKANRKAKLSVKVT
jgi:hypothetical protein